MPGIHPLLERHLTRHGIMDLASPPTVEEWYRFLERISQTYAEADARRSELERQLSTVANGVETERAERRRAEAELQRLHALCENGMKQMAGRIQSGAETGDMLALLTSIRSEFERSSRSA